MKYGCLIIVGPHPPKNDIKLAPTTRPYKCHKSYNHIEHINMYVHHFVLLEQCNANVLFEVIEKKARQRSGLRCVKIQYLGKHVL